MIGKSISEYIRLKKKVSYLANKRIKRLEEKCLYNNETF